MAANGTGQGETEARNATGSGARPEGGEDRGQPLSKRKLRWIRAVAKGETLIGAVGSALSRVKPGGKPRKVSEGMAERIARRYLSDPAVRLRLAEECLIRAESARAYQVLSWDALEIIRGALSGEAQPDKARLELAKQILVSAGAAPGGLTSKNGPRNKGKAPAAPPIPMGGRSLEDWGDGRSVGSGRTLD